MKLHGVECAALVFICLASWYIIGEFITLERLVVVAAVLAGVVWLSGWSADRLYKWFIK